MDLARIFVQWGPLNTNCDELRRRTVLDILVPQEIHERCSDVSQRGHITVGSHGCSYVRINRILITVKLTPCRGIAI
jgi:hypothetical protein